MSKTQFWFQEARPSGEAVRSLKFITNCFISIALFSHLPASPFKSPSDCNITLVIQYCHQCWENITTEKEPNYYCSVNFNVNSHTSKHLLTCQAHWYWICTERSIHNNLQERPYQPPFFQRRKLSEAHIRQMAFPSHDMLLRQELPDYKILTPSTRFSCLFFI